MTDVRQNAKRGRFEVWVDGELAGQLDYQPDGGVWVLPHAEVPPAFGGRGLAGDLARAALDAARAAGVKVRPSCSYVAGWISRHPDYADLVA